MVNCRDDNVAKLPRAKASGNVGVGMVTHEQASANFEFQELSSPGKAMPGSRDAVRRRNKSKNPRSCWAGYSTQVREGIYLGIYLGIYPALLAGRFCTILVPVPISRVSFVLLSVPYPNPG